MASVAVDAGADGLRAALQETSAVGVHVEDVALRRPTLDEVFLSLTGHGTPGGTAVRARVPGAEAQQSAATERSAR